MTNLHHSEESQPEGGLASGLGPGLAELAGLLEKLCVSDGVHHPEPWTGSTVYVVRTSAPTQRMFSMYSAVLCVIAQGSKQVFLGSERFVYDQGRFLLNSVALPASGQVLEATPERPCLSLVLELDPALVASVIVECGAAPSGTPSPLRSMESSLMDRPLLDSVVRLARLFSSPEDAPFLAPLAMREIVYRLLRGEQSARLHQVAAHGAQAHRVMHAVEWLRQNYNKPLSLEKLARETGMSTSALHHHFKDVTAMSPLQFQKHMRLQEAQRLMVGQGLDAATAGVRVGYDDPSYFSRDYRRFFGEPPRRHAQSLRHQAA